MWVLDGSDFPKHGRNGGSGPAVLREAGEGGQLPGGDVPGLCQPVGTGIGGQGAVSPRVGPRTKTGVRRRVAAGGRQGYRSKTELALEMVGRAQERGHLKAGVRGGRRLWDVAVLPGGPGGLGDVVRAGRSVRLYGVAAGACLDQCGVSGIRASPQTQAARRSAPDHGAAQRRVAKAWLEITVAEGSQGPRTPFQRPEGATDQQVQARRNPLGRLPSGTGTAANPATTCPMLRRIPRWRPSHTWEAPVGYRNGV